MGVTPVFLFPGETVRLVLSGRQSHAVEGVVLESSHKEVSIKRSGSGDPLRIPATALVSCEVEIRDGAATRMVPGQLPVGLAEALVPLAGMFLTGTGALQKDLSHEAVLEYQRVLDRVSEAIISPEIRSCLERIQNALGFFLNYRRSDPYEQSLAVKTRAIKEIRKNPDFFGLGERSELDLVRDAAHRLSQIIESFWASLQNEYAPKPMLDTSSTVRRVYASKNGEADLPIRVRLDRSSAPATQLEIIIDDPDEFEFLGSVPSLDTLEPGSAATVMCRVVMRVPRQATPLKLRAQIMHRLPNGGVRHTPKQSLDFMILPEGEFEEIANPYRAYAGGVVVQSPEMFFGRSGLLSAIVNDLRTGPVGQSVALYGQKRTGKSSVLSQIRSRLDASQVITVWLSIGTLDRISLTVSFVRTVLSSIRLDLLGLLTDVDFKRLDLGWPTDERIERRPLESLEHALIASRTLMKKYPSGSLVRFVLLVDEFTYLFEMLRDPDYGPSTKQNVKEFLRVWKGLMERQLFSSVVVGQDTMPYFMESFPNEFSSMRSIHLSYLDEGETRSLADDPTRSVHGSRYTGFAIESVFSYTSGHPFFTQILCDRIVENANRAKRQDFPELAVSEAVESLLSGPTMLSPHVFDCLLTADNSGLVFRRDGSDVLSEDFDAKKGVAYEILSRIAVSAGAGMRPVPIDELDLSPDEIEVLNDLKVRRVVSGIRGLQIVVPLFSEFLRRTS